MNKSNEKYKREVYVLPKELDEKVAQLHLKALGAELTILTKEQADYIGVDTKGPFKKPTYRYWEIDSVYLFYSDIYLWYNFYLHI